MELESNEEIIRLPDHNDDDSLLELEFEQILEDKLGFTQPLQLGLPKEDFEVVQRGMKETKSSASISPLKQILNKKEQLRMKMVEQS